MASPLPLFELSCLAKKLVDMDGCQVTPGQGVTVSHFTLRCYQIDA